MASACSVRVRGVVQGVGFRPFVYRLAHAYHLTGWVLNAEEGVEIRLEGRSEDLASFVRDLEAQPPAAACIAAIEVKPEEPVGLLQFEIRESGQGEAPTVRISPDLALCDDCRRELFDPGDRRYHYPYINCTNCGPRYTVILALPYDRARTTMKDWSLDRDCETEYRDPGNRRFHAEPIACPACGPGYRLELAGETLSGDVAIRRAVELLRNGGIVAIKGLGGYHLACDALSSSAVNQLRERKYRKEKPFALMAGDLAAARRIVRLSSAHEELLASVARPIVLAPAIEEIPGVAPDNHELGVMLPYTPLQCLLFDAGAPLILVMTSGNRSSEPIAYEDEDARLRLSGLADAFLVGERPIARRVEDSVVRAGTFGPAILRRARGYAPGAVATLPIDRPLLAVGADLKNTVTLVVKGQAFVSQHVGDLEHYPALLAFQQTIQDLISMYEVSWDDLVLVHDAHPQYLSTTHALTLPAADKRAVQHHRAHIASVLAERGAWEKPVLGVSWDGTGYGDDGAIWGGEFFVGSIREGFERVAHLRPAALPGGDRAALYPVQAAAGFLGQIDQLPSLHQAPFHFPSPYQDALQIVRRNVRTFPTTSVGRLFDTAAALLGFTRQITFEGQAAMWLEHLAHSSADVQPYPFPFHGRQLDFRPLLLALALDRVRGRATSEIARAFQRGVAHGLCDAVTGLTSAHGLDTVVLSGGVFQNQLLLADIQSLLPPSLAIWTNHAVPANDGGISLGQAALGAFMIVAIV
ncbi:MAG TPA: carbamoyltransferase HypF [Terriglobales bacterium]|nr:carbamoyltransferase HypF [Terriglobales bacterium]